MRRSSERSAAEEDEAEEFLLVRRFSDPVCRREPSSCSSLSTPCSDRNPGDGSCSSPGDRRLPLPFPVLLPWPLPLRLRLPLPLTLPLILPLGLPLTLPLAGLPLAGLLLAGLPSVLPLPLPPRLPSWDRVAAGETCTCRSWLSSGAGRLAEEELLLLLLLLELNAGVEACLSSVAVGNPEDDNLHHDR